MYFPGRTKLIIYLILGFSQFDNLYAQPQADSTTVDNWRKEHLISNPSATPHQMIIVESHGQNPPYSFPHVEGALEIANKQILWVSPDKMRLMLRMNPSLSEDSDGKKNLARIAAAVEADMILLIDRDEEQRSLFVAIQDNLHEVDRSPIKSGPLQGGEIAAWTAQAVGYNGYVVDVRKNQLLIASSSPLLRTARQGLVLRRNSQMPGVAAKADAILGIIEKHAEKDDFGIFRMILPQATDTIKPGDFVLLSQ